MQKKIIYGVLSIAVLAMAVVFSFNLLKSKPLPEKDGAKHDITFVKAESVKMINEKVDMSYRGRITAFDNVLLSAEVSGKIMAGDVRFKEGETFKKGQVIVRIYSEDVEASLKSAKSGFLQTLAMILPDLKVDYSDQYDKWLAFFNAFDVEKTLPVLPTIDSNKEKVFLAANNVLASYYSLLQQELQLSRYVIRAPFNGAFKTVNKEIGAVSSPSAQLANIIRTDKLEVTVPVFPVDLVYIEEGEQVEIISQSGKSKQAKVSRISSFVESTTRSVNVYLTYNANGTSGFLEGQFVDVYFGGQIVKGFRIPREALFDKNKVYVLNQGSLDILKVNVLRRMDDYYIINGIAEGTQIVTESLASVNSSVEYKAR